MLKLFKKSRQRNLEVLSRSLDIVNKVSRVYSSLDCSYLSFEEVKGQLLMAAKFHGLAIREIAYLRRTII